MAGNIIAIPAAIATTSTNTGSRTTIITPAANHSKSRWLTLLDGAEVTFRLVEHVQTAFGDREMGAVESERTARFAVGNPREGAQVRQTHLDRLALHVLERGVVELLMVRTNVIACAVQ